MKFTLLAAVLFGSLALTSCSESPSVAGDYVAKLKSGSGDAQGATSEGDSTNNGDSTAGTQTPAPATPTPSTTPTAQTPTPATPTPTPTPTTPTPTTPTGSELTYANVNAKVFGPNCVACHGTMGNVNLETLQKVKQYITGVKKQAITDKLMPPGAPLSADLQKLLGDWIAAGTPE